jgi:hypothetical protein
MKPLLRQIAINIVLLLIYLVFAFSAPQPLFGMFFWVSFFPIILLVNIFSIQEDNGFRYRIILLILSLVAWLLIVYCYPFPKLKDEQANSYNLLYWIDIYGFAVAFIFSVFYICLDFALRKRRGIDVNGIRKTERAKRWHYIFLSFNILSLFLCIPNFLWIIFLSMLGDIQNVRIFLPIPLSALFLASFQAFPLIFMFTFVGNRGMGLKP